MKLWLNGVIAEAGDTHIDAADRGVLLGDGLFETMLVRYGKIPFFEQHLLRLMNGAKSISLPVPHAPGMLKQACRDLLRENNLLDRDRASLRLTLTRGPGPRGLAFPPEPRPTVLIAASPAAPPPEQLSLATVTPRRNPWSPSARLKALAYLDNIVAREEAREKGAEDALMLDTGGMLACTSIANIFVWNRDRLLTPADRGAILPGITRAALLELAPDIGIEAREEDIAPEMLRHATGIFVTNSLMGLVPVTRIDGREVPAHPMTARLAAAYELLLEAAAAED